MLALAQEVLAHVVKRTQESLALQLRRPRHVPQTLHAITQAVNVNLVLAALMFATAPHAANITSQWVEQTQHDEQKQAAVVEGFADADVLVLEEAAEPGVDFASLVVVADVEIDGQVQVLWLGRHRGCARMV